MFSIVRSFIGAVKALSIDEVMMSSKLWYSESVWRWEYRAGDKT
jgi:hypothetical protein